MYTNWVDLLKETCLLRGDFTLSSGKKSDIYFDIRRAALHPDLLLEIVARFEELMTKHSLEHVTRIGGPSSGADTLVAALLSYVSFFRRPVDYRGFLVRKEPKVHGTSRLIEGFVPRLHDRALILEDVATTGKSILHAVRAVKETGAVVQHAFVVLDRQEGAEAALGAEGVKLFSLLTKADLGI